MLNTGILSCVGPETLEARYTLEMFEDEPHFAIVEIEVASRFRCLILMPELTLHTVDDHSYALTVMSFEHENASLWFQASGMLLQEERFLERAA